MHDGHQLSDNDLLELFRTGDRDSYESIYKRYWPILYAHARNMLRKDDEAKDVIQEVFSHLWTCDKDRLQSISLAPFLYTITRNKVLNVIKHLNIESKYANELKEIMTVSFERSDDLILERELAMQIEAGIDLLPVKMKEVFLLSRKGYLSHKEISEHLNISDKTVKKQISNALHFLKNRLTFLFLFF